MGVLIVHGFVLAKQVHFVDGRARRIRRLGRGPYAMVDQVLTPRDAVPF